MRSHFLEGQVRHRRARPFVYSLEHGVTYLALDLDELDGIEGASSVIRRNRPGILEIRDSDHLDPPAVDLRSAVNDLLRSAGEDPTGWRVTLVTNLRVLGYVFNPASFYLCRDPDGCLRIVIVEVHNTHGAIQPAVQLRWAFACETKRHACGSRSTTREPRGCCSTRASTSSGVR